MPRREFNNPSERINRILEEIADLESCYIFARDLIATYLPDQFYKLGSEPNLSNIMAERTRQDLTRTKVRYTRDAVRALRLRGVVQHHESFKPAALPDWRTRPDTLSEATKRQIERETEEIEKKYAHLKPPPAWQPKGSDGKFKACQYGGFCPMETMEECECRAVM